MTGTTHAAGPEWAYLAPLTTNSGVPTDLDSLFLNVTVQPELAKPDKQTKILNLQTLIIKRGVHYGPHDVTRFSFARFRELTGIGDLELYFYEGAVPKGVAIPDEPSFQRLLLAVHHLGYSPLSASERIYAPPVLMFYARPKPPPPPNKLLQIIQGLIIFVFLVIFLAFLWEYGAGAVITGIIFITLMLDQANQASRAQNQRRRN